MLKKATIILGSGILLLAVLLVSSVAIFFYIFPYNIYTDSVEVVSPDKRYVAIGFHVIGGATTRNSTIIQLRSNNFFGGTKIPVFIVDMIHPDNPFNISWVKKNELVVTYTPGSIYIQKFSWKDVTIKYIQK